MVAARKKIAGRQGVVASWASRVKDTAQVCLAIVTIAGVPVGAYFYLLPAINGTRHDLQRQFSGLEGKIDAGFAKIHEDMTALTHRQNYVELQTRDLREEIGVERAERNKDRRESAAPAASKPR